MPELPEVETVRRTLAGAVGMSIVGARVSDKTLRLGQRIERARLMKTLGQGRITALRRHGKYLLVDGSKAHAMLVHLGMSGRFRLCDVSVPEERHTHVVLSLKKGRVEKELRFIDPRRFGFVDVVALGHEKEHPALAELGPDPLNSDVTGDYLYEASRGRKVAIKQFLLNQSVIAGIGNIYASEALWLARIPPQLSTRRFTRPRADALAGAIRTVLEGALTRGGTTLRDFVAGDGAEGGNWDYLKVYDRADERCPNRCGGRIHRSVQQGRSTFHCPRCQRR